MIGAGSSLLQAKANANGRPGSSTAARQRGVPSAPQAETRAIVAWRQLHALLEALRYAHSIAYLCRLQPWRALLYLGGMLVCWLIALRILMMVV